jgi:hypothetical protein
LPGIIKGKDGHKEEVKDEPYGISKMHRNNFTEPLNVTHDSGHDDPGRIDCKKFQRLILNGTIKISLYKAFQISR